MAETTTEVRAEIEQTRARMAAALAELEKKADIAERVREHPWAALALAFGAGVALSRSSVDVKAAEATAAVTKGTGTKLGSALDNVLAVMIGGIAGALHSKVDEVVSTVVTSVKREPVAPYPTPPDHTAVAIRAD